MFYAVKIIMVKVTTLLPEVGNKIPKFEASHFGRIDISERFQ